jgi:hypothetical protein
MKKQWGRIFFVILAGSLTCGIGYWFHNQMHYEVLEIPVPSGFEEPYCLKLNDSGTVATIMNSIADKSQHLFYWNRDTGFTDLGNLGIAGVDISIMDMNNAGQLVGIYSVVEKLNDEAVQSGVKPRRDLHSFFYDPQQGLREIPATPGRIKPWAIAINNHGQVAGMDHAYSGGNVTQNLFLWTLEGGAEDIQAVGFPEDINDSAHIVGETIRPGNGFFWSRETGQVYLSGPLTGNRVSMKINNSDQVVGLYGPDLYHLRLFRWNPHRGIHNVGYRSYDLSDLTDLTDNGGYGLYFRRTWELPWILGHGQKNTSIAAIPGRFKTNLNRAIGKPDLEFYAADMNNNGWIIGVARDQQSNQFEGLLLLIPKNYPKSK